MPAPSSLRPRGQNPGAPSRPSSSMWRWPATCRSGDPQRAVGQRPFRRDHTGHRSRHRRRSLRMVRAGCEPCDRPHTLVVDAQDRYLVPGLCDAHMHVESGMVTVTEFCRAVIPTAPRPCSSTRTRSRMSWVSKASGSCMTRRGCAHLRLRADAVLRPLCAGSRTCRGDDRRR